VPSSTEWDYCREAVRSATSLDNWGLMLKSFFPRSKLIMNTIWHSDTSLTIFQVFSTFHDDQCSSISLSVIFLSFLSCDWLGEVSSHASFYVCWGSRVLRFTWHSLRAENVFTFNGNSCRRIDTPCVSYFCLIKGHTLLGSSIHPCCVNLVLQPPPPPPQSW